MNVSETTDKMARLLQAAGFQAVLAAVSESSDSRYLDVSINNGEDSRSWKVRISNHELPPTYANARPSDYEIGDNNGYAVAGMSEWYKLVQVLCDDNGLAYPPLLKAMVSKEQQKRLAEAGAKLDAQRAEMEQDAEDESEATAIYLFNINKITSQVERIDSASGQKRRQLRSRFNQQWRDVCNPNKLAEIARRNNGN